MVFLQGQTNKPTQKIQDLSVQLWRLELWRGEFTFQYGRDEFVQQILFRQLITQAEKNTQRLLSHVTCKNKYQVNERPKPET